MPSRHLSLAGAAGADALRRREGWPETRIRSHLKSGMHPGVLTDAQRSLLEVQVANLIDSGDLQRQIDVIDACFEPSRVL